MLGVVLPVWMAVAVVVGLGAMVIARRSLGVGVLGLLVAGGAVAGAVADARTGIPITDPPTGSIVIEATVVVDPIEEWDHLAVLSPVAAAGRAWRGPLLAAGPLPDVRVGDAVEVRGRLEAGIRRIRTRVVSGTVRVDTLVAVRPSKNPLVAIGNGLRERVRSTFDDPTPSAALVTGLLIGDTSEVPAGVLEDLRRSGLSHYVAVSGSNVALFLGVWWLLGAPLSIRPKVRVAYGLIGLAVFAVATRFEPSVIRASVMAAVPLVGGLVSIPVDPWMALGIAVAIIVLVSADLVSSVGFLLSVLATAGVLVGLVAVRHRRPRWFWVPLGATVGAQAAVAPLLLSVFGSVPLAAPLTNLMAGPVVVITSGLGLAAVVVPVPVLVDATEMGASILVAIADHGSGGPQLGVVGVFVAVFVAVLLVVPVLRPLGVAAAIVGLLLLAPLGPAWPEGPTAVVLDIGQGDAILVLDPSGRSMLVDGGPDPARLEAALRRHGIRSVDVVTVTHGDTDHAGGLVELVASGRVGALVRSAFAPDEGLIAELDTLAVSAGTPVFEVEAGWTFPLGGIQVEVLGPARRFASDNDGSVVLMVTAHRSLLLPGDIEAIAQRELPLTTPDAMVVPHHGSATTDLAWLASVLPSQAVLSYGENRFGHPHPDVVAILEAAGAHVHHTHRDGDVIIPLDARGAP